MESTKGQLKLHQGLVSELERIKKLVTDKSAEVQQLLQQLHSKEIDLNNAQLSNQE